MEIELGKKPSAWIPVLMSLGALALVVIQIATHGVQPESDEGALAHLWQILVLAQLPVIGFFALRWLKAYPGRCVPVLATQLVALAAALVPAHTMGWQLEVRVHLLDSRFRRIGRPWRPTASEPPS